MIDVAAAVIRDAKGRVLVCRRGPARDQAGLWEFPGGKLEPGEAPGEALARECLEELGASVKVGEKLLETVHDYPEKTVRLIFMEARIASGEPKASVHAELRWAGPAELESLAFCQADRSMAASLAREARGGPPRLDEGFRPNQGKAGEGGEKRHGGGK